MTLEEIFDEWAQDSKIDRTNLGNHAISIAKLHHKYHQFLSKERLLTSKLQAEMKTLKLDKNEFYGDGPNQDHIEKGWKLPPKGRILKSDLPNYIEADKDIIELNLKIAYQNEKVELLISILKTITNMGFHIKSAIDYQKLTSGEMI